MIIIIVMSALFVKACIRYRVLEVLLGCSWVAVGLAVDVAFVVSADNDLITPIEKALAMGKIVIVAYPSHRKSQKLSQASTGDLKIRYSAITKNGPPEELLASHGVKILVPRNWQ